MNASNTKIAAVVVSHNAEKWIEACLSSLVESAFQPRVYVVDNASSDATVSIIDRQFPNVVLIRSAENVGFGRANNLALREVAKSDAEFVFLLNQDARAEQGALQALVECASRSSEFGILSPLHLNYEGGAIDPHTHSYLLPDCADYFNDLVRGTSSEVYRLNFMPAAGWLVRMQALKACGGFDPLFFMYGEDWDLCARFRRHNWKIGLVPGARIRHWHGGTESKPKSVAGEASEVYWQMLSWLKDPSQPLVKQIANIARENIARSVRHLLYFELEELAGRIKAVSLIAARFGSILEHRKLCAQGGPLFIS